MLGAIRLCDRKKNCITRTFLRQHRDEIGLRDSIILMVAGGKKEWLSTGSDIHEVFAEVINIMGKMTGID